MPRALRGRPTRPTPKAKCSTAGRFGRFAQLDSGLGCRSSQLQLLLYRFARAARDRDVKPADLVALGTRRFRPRQFFRALDTLLEVQAPLSSLTSMVRQKRYTEVLLQHPLFLITALGRIRTDIRKPEGRWKLCRPLRNLAMVQPPFRDCFDRLNGSMHFRKRMLLHAFPWFSKLLFF